MCVMLSWFRRSGIRCASCKKKTLKRKKTFFFSPTMIHPTPFTELSRPITFYFPPSHIPPQLWNKKYLSWGEGRACPIFFSLFLHLSVREFMTARGRIFFFSSCPPSVMAHEAESPYFALPRNETKIGPRPKCKNTVCQSKSYALA